MDIVGRRFWYFLFSAIMLVPGAISLLIPPRLDLGIEFTGGSTISVEFQSPVTEGQVRDALGSMGHAEAIIQTAGANGYFIRTSAFKPAPSPDATSEQQQVLDALGKLAPISRKEVSTVSGVVAKDTVQAGFLAVALASVAILLYLTWAFRKVPKAYRYGGAAVIALLHDALLVLGMFSLLGKFMHLEVDAMFIPAILTIIGYSVHDTIVVFDRIRENSIRTPEMPFAQIANNSVLETMARSLNTVITVLVSLLAMLLLGGASLRPFLIALLIGFCTGAYSSIGVASSLLVTWENGDIGRLFGRKPAAQASRAEGRA